MALIRKQYAAPVLADEMNKIISEELSAYITKEKIDILGNPIPETSTEASGNWESLKTSPLPTKLASLRKST